MTSTQPACLYKLISSQYSLLCDVNLASVPAYFSQSAVLLS